VRVRRRNSVLEALHLIRESAPRLGPVDQIALFYVAENPGISIAELAYVARVNMMTASRIARRLAASGEHGEPGLVDIRPNPADARGLMLFLTDRGVKLCHDIDHAIGLAVKIGLGDNADDTNK
jgi:DNA-binding MarR family transcriptional regulator